VKVSRNLKIKKIGRKEKRNPVKRSDSGKLPLPLLKKKNRSKYESI